jgi:hypothetical protein
MTARSYLGYLSVVVSSLLFAPVEASALQYRPLPLDPPLVGVALTGPIVSGDFERLNGFLQGLAKSDGVLSFFVDSPGGSIFEAEKIAGLINKGGAWVSIPSGSQCSSACFLLFAAAARRFMAPDALIGVHSVSESGQENLTAMGCHHRLRARGCRIRRAASHHREDGSNNTSADSLAYTH